MDLNIVSWNTFGAGIEKISEVYGKLFLNGYQNIILVQEAGAFKDEYYFKCLSHKFGTKEYYGYFVPQPNAKNERCTTGIFAEKTLFTSVPTFTFLERKDKRPVVCVNIGSESKSFLLATVHATACEYLAKGEIASIFGQLAAKNPKFLLMGDFNCNPDRLLKEEKIPAKNISFPVPLTQRSGGTLDYAVFSDNFSGIIKVQAGCPKDPKFFPGTSDHIPVFVQFSM